MGVGAATNVVSSGHDRRSMPRCEERLDKGNDKSLLNPGWILSAIIYRYAFGYVAFEVGLEGP